MQLVKPYARIMDLETPQDGIRLLRKIELCGRVSHASEDAQTEDSWKRFIQFVVLEKGDWSITEHASISVDFLVDRGISHELVRHRLFSFTQSSTRFINYAKKMPASFVDPFQDSTRTLAIWSDAIETCEEAYRALLSAGCAPQIARSVLPNALSTRIIVTGNLRNWRHLLIMRTTKEAHPQMREVTIPLLEDFQRLIPILFSDIVPNEKQSVAISKGR